MKRSQNGTFLKKQSLSILGIFLGIIVMGSTSAFSQNPCGVPCLLTFPPGNHCATGSLAPTSPPPNLIPCMDTAQTIFSSYNYSFTGSPGAVVFSVDGSVNLGATGPGTYDVYFEDWTGCKDTATITIIAADDPNFAYPVICDSAGLVSPSMIATPGGVFSVDTANSNPKKVNPFTSLSLTSSTGQIDPDSAVAGQYAISYTTAGTCPTTKNKLITVNPKPRIALSYSLPPGGLCTHGTAWYPPTITNLATMGPIQDIGGNNPGLFLPSALLNFSVASGYNQPSGAPEEGSVHGNGSSPGTNILTYVYQSSVGCTDTVTASIQVQAGPNPLFSYPQDTICYIDTLTTSLLTPSSPGTGGGAWASVSGDFVVPNSANGIIDLTATIGNLPSGQSRMTDVIVYTVTTGTCTASDSFTVTLNAGDEVPFNYSDPWRCQGESDTIAPDSGYTPGGVFSEPSGTLYLVDTANGLFDLAQSNYGANVVIFYTAGACPGISRDTITIEPIDDPGFYYSTGTAVCRGTPPISPTFTGIGGGAFSVTGGTGLGITMNFATGEINTWQSGPGDYYIQYSTAGLGLCPGIMKDTITILPQDTAKLQYNNSPYCTSQDTLVPDLITSSGTCFELTGSVVFIDSVAGVIDLPATGAVGPGPFQIIYITTGCPDTAKQTIQVFVDDTANVLYPDSGVYCQEDNYPTPTIIGAGGGTFTSSSGTNFPVVDSTGRITWSTNNLPSTTNNFNITYSTASISQCPVTVVTPITVYKQGNPNFNYDVNFCKSESPSGPVSVSDSTGADYFHCIPAGSTQNCDSLNIDSVTGVIYPSTSSLGTYTIEHYVPGLPGGCFATATQQIHIQQDVPAVIDYPDTLYCQSHAPVAPSLITSDSSGSFFSSLIPGTGPAGGILFFISNKDGLINFEISAPGKYSIQYKIPGACTETARDSLWIFLDDTAYFDYDKINFCQGDPNPIPDTITLPGGVFSEGTGSVYFIDSINGLISLDSSINGGPFFIEYTTNGICPSTFTDNITIDIKPTPLLQPDNGIRICQGQSVNFDVLNVPTGQGFIDFIFYINDVEKKNYYENFYDPFAEDTILIQNGDEIKVTARFSIQNGGCEASDSLNMIVYPNPTGTITLPAGTITADDPLDIKVETNADSTTFFWEMHALGQIVPDELLNQATLPIMAGGWDYISPQLSFLDKITPAQLTFYIQPIAFWQCRGAIDTIVININPPQTPVFIPGVITPNGDGSNDTWQIQLEEGLDPNDYYVEVFNRSGGRVHQMPSIVSTWGGEGLPDGVYWYIIYDKKTNKDAFHGGLTIRRKKTVLTKN
ncbi:MAG: gliding motility-associated C-terminal domain-containing protein [Bacteroidia bacterium]|nr:gliding motility-associated C-terminal domain-containing protein [Bacteroidia bacterium]